MPLPPAPRLAISEADRKELLSLSRQRSIPQGILLRLNIVLGAAEGRANHLLARELSNDVDVLIVANPCFGLDFVSVADIRAHIMEQRNRGAAVLLVSEDLDEILELSDRVAVISEGKVAYLTDAAGADRTTIGRYMAGH